MLLQLIKGLGGSEKVVISEISEMISQLARFSDILNISPVLLYLGFLENMSVFTILQLMVPAGKLSLLF